MTRYNDEDREQWDADESKSKRCLECGLDPDHCECEKELDEIF